MSEFEPIGLGLSANDGLGDTARSAGEKLNRMLEYLFTQNAALKARLALVEQKPGTTPAPTPAFTSKPSITGTPTVGQPLSSLTFTDGAVSNGSVTSRAYLLAGVTKALSYVLTADDVGAALTFRNSATGTDGSTVTSTSTAVVVSAAAPAPSPSIAFANPAMTVNEGNTGTTTVSNTINVTRNGVTGPLTVNLTYGGTATSGVDYVPGLLSLTLPDGVSSGSFDLTINGDATVETDETIIINAALAGYAATASKTITVSNDDAGSGTTPFTPSVTSPGMPALPSTSPIAGA